MEQPKAGLLVGIAFKGPDHEWKMGRPVMPEWALALAVQSYPLNCNILHYSVKGKSIDFARTEFVRQALKLNIPYVWFLDDDVAPPYFAARQLMSTLKQGNITGTTKPMEKFSPDEVMVAGGIYTCRGLPTEPLLYRGNGDGCFWGWKHGDIFDVTGIATGCMMVKTEVFRHIEEPWFLTIDTPEPARLEGDLEGATHTQMKITDDLYFCDKVREAGYKILADSNVLCLHWDVAEGKAYKLDDNSYPMKQEEAFAMPV